MVTYKIVYTKKAIKDIKNLKSAGIDKKAKMLVELIKQNPYQTILGCVHGQRILHGRIIQVTIDALQAYI